MRWYDVVWFWHPIYWSLGFYRFTDKGDGSWALIFDWWLCLGPLQIRKRLNWRDIPRSRAEVGDVNKPSPVIGYGQAGIEGRAP